MNEYDDLAICTRPALHDFMCTACHVAHTSEKPHLLWRARSRAVCLERADEEIRRLAAVLALTS